MKTETTAFMQQLIIFETVLVGWTQRQTRIISPAIVDVEHISWLKQPSHTKSTDKFLTHFRQCKEDESTEQK